MVVSGIIACKSITVGIIEETNAPPVVTGINVCKGVIAGIIEEIDAKIRVVSDIIACNGIVA